MLTLTITKAEAPAKTGTSVRTGKPYSIPEQEAYITLGQERRRIVVALPKERQGNPYPVGDYTLAPESFYVDRFGQLQLSPRLAPVAAKPKV